MRAPSDPRYGTRRWKALRLRVLRRDSWACFFRDPEPCQTEATVADHIERVTRDTTDAEFFNASGLRAACRRHNFARSIIAYATTAEPDAPRTARRRHSYGPR